MAFQEFQILLLERFTAMVILLIADVINHSAYVRR